MIYLNKNINKISEYPFSRLRDLLSKEKKSNKSKILDLSIGQPYHKFPIFVKNTLAKENTKWSTDGRKLERDGGTPRGAEQLS